MLHIKDVNIKLQIVFLFMVCIDFSFIGYIKYWCLPEENERQEDEKDNIKKGHAPLNCKVINTILVFWFYWNNWN